MKVSVLLPARNEESVIGKMVRMILAIYYKWVIEVIVVDDGSTDRTAAIVKAIARHDPRVRLIKRSAPHGVGLAIRDGLAQVSPKADYVFSLDADFLRNIPDLEDFFLLARGYDGLIGSRYIQKDSLVHYPLLKRFFNRTFHLLVRLIYGVRVHDLTNNFKLYKKEVFNKLPLTSSGYAINAETGLYPVLLGYKIKELPVTWYARTQDMGQSKFLLLKVAPEYIKVLLRASRFMKEKRGTIVKLFARLTK